MKNNKQKFFLFISFSIFLFVVILFARTSSAVGTPQCPAAGCFTVGVSVDGHSVSNVSSSPAAGINMNSCTSQGCVTSFSNNGGTASYTNPAILNGNTPTNASAATASNLLTVSGSTDPNYVASSVTVACAGSPAYSVPLNSNGQANLGALPGGSINLAPAPSPRGGTNATGRTVSEPCQVIINYVRDRAQIGNNSPTSECPGYTVSSCAVGSCILRDASSCDEVSTCAPEYGCETTIGVDVTPMSRTVAPGGTASYDVEVSQNFTTSAPIYDIHLYSSMNYPGTSITWEIPSDQTSKIGFANSSTTGNNVLIKMKESRAVIRMNVVTTSELVLGTKVFFVTADPGAETCYGQCNAMKSQINLVVQNGMTGTLTPRSNSCVIARGASTCNINFDWHVTNPVVVGGSAVTKNPNVTVGSGDNRTNVPLSIKWGGDTFYLYNNGVLLDQKIVDASSVTCASGTSWNGSVCAVPTTTPTNPNPNNPNPNPNTPTNPNTPNNPNPNTPNNPNPNTPNNPNNQVSMSGSISSTPPSCFIPLGGSSCNVTLNWNTTNPEAVSEVTSAYPAAGTSIANGNNGGKTVAIPHFSSPRSFYLYNNSKLVDQVSVVADCVIGTVWDINTSKCIASNVTVMSGALMPDRDNCIIPTGSNACLIQFSWMTVHPEAVSRVTSDTTDTGNPAADTFVVDGNNGGPAPFVIPYPSRNFFLYNNGVLLDQKAGGTITAVCASDASFDVSRNKCMSTVPNNPGSGIPGGGGIGGGGNGSDIVFDASAKNIFTGQPTTLTWSSSFACTGTNFNTGGASTGNLTLRPVTTTTYTVTCGGHSRSLTVVVRRQPGFIEQ